MSVSGVTSSKLSKVSRFNPNEPYKVGVKGVTAIDDIGGGFISIKYTIDGIEYETVTPNVSNTPGRKLANPRPNQRFNLSDGLLSIVKNEERSITTFKSPYCGKDFEKYPAIKEEELLGQVFPPEIKDEIFIERGVGSIFERHARLGDINNIEQLENYKNGFFNLLKRY